MWYRRDTVSSSENQHMQIVAFGKWRIDSFMRWQLQKKKIPLNWSNIEKKPHKLPGPAEVSYKDWAQAGSNVGS